MESGHNDIFDAMGTSSPKTMKPDGRLFPNHPLYCEGFHRPKCRGMMHLVAAILLPFAWWHLYLEANGSIIAEIVASLYVLSNIICYGASALFHVS
jgi:predicted membrane channel-forming protein YqfA (hemolysin III family)